MDSRDTWSRSRVVEGEGIAGRYESLKLGSMVLFHENIQGSALFSVTRRWLCRELPPVDIVFGEQKGL